MSAREQSTAVRGERSRADYVPVTRIDTLDGGRATSVEGSHRMEQTATVSPLVRRADKLGAAFDECHAYGHSWYDCDADKPPSFGFYLWVRCERCMTTRKDIVNHVGELLSRSYDYPEGYRESGFDGEVRLARTDYRLRLVARRSQTGRLKKAWRR